MTKDLTRPKALECVHQYRCEFLNRLDDQYKSLYGGPTSVLNGNLQTIIDHCIRMLDDVWGIGMSDGRSAHDFAREYLTKKSSGPAAARQDVPPGIARFS